MAELDLSPALRESVGRSQKAFVAAVGEVRPRLHRFCARMCGSSLDGEDVVQETLAEAFYTLSTLRDAGRLEPWIFRIAYHKCIDFLRRERRHEADIPLDDDIDRADALGNDSVGDASLPIDEALATLVGELPPKERASLLLKDVLDYPLAEVAEIVDSTLGGVKAALHRARAKISAGRATPPPPVARLDGDQRRLFEAYADVFNRRDWAALKDLVSADARLEIVGEAVGQMSGLGATYSGNYTSLAWEWRLGVALVDGEPAIVHWRRSVGDSDWRAHSAIKLEWHDGKVARVRDYIHVDYLLRDSSIKSL